MGRRTNPGIRCVGITVNTSALPAGERSAYLRDLAQETGLPCCDPVKDGCGVIVDYIRTVFEV
jgi:uncharacterized NAD-dependent epimerase/dehydratase family protein